MSQRTTRGIRYTGDLARPIHLGLKELSPGPSDNLSSSSALRQKAEEIIDRERSRRLELLFEWHNVTAGDYVGLALALAFAHVPGMQVTMFERKRGRPSVSRKEWDSLQKNHPGANTLLLLMHVANKGPKGKVGAPQKWPPEVLEYLVLEADRWKDAQRKAGVQRPSDRGFIEAILKIKPATRRGKSATAKGRSRGAWLSALARGRKMIRNRH